MARSEAQVAEGKRTLHRGRARRWPGAYWTGRVPRPVRCYVVTAADGCRLRILSSGGRPSAALVAAVDALTHAVHADPAAWFGKEPGDVPDLPASDAS